MDHADNMHRTTSGCGSHVGSTPACPLTWWYSFSLSLMQHGTTVPVMHAVLCNNFPQSKYLQRQPQEQGARVHHGFRRFSLFSAQFELRIFFLLFVMHLVCSLRLVLLPEKSRATQLGHSEAADQRGHDAPRGSGLGREVCDLYINPTQQCGRLGEQERPPCRHGVPLCEC